MSQETATVHHVALKTHHHPSYSVMSPRQRSGPRLCDPVLVDHRTCGHHLERLGLGHVCALCLDPACSFGLNLLALHGLDIEGRSWLQRWLCVCQLPSESERCPACGFASHRARFRGRYRNTATSSAQRTRRLVVSSWFWVVSSRFLVSSWFEFPTDHDTDNCHPFHPDNFHLSSFDFAADSRPRHPLSGTLN